ncbi:ribokinase [Zophobihabitans entericus]|uniref:Ribokinase n=1 Tax=Zophobihabitans entericus TaxID=1635327 RepID=A0A6G9IAR3_9GAMM|nr:ribokinase [Zophobihabitans entericus]QIQ20922.1 ribokinase [Zophobihabitans entericus]
MFTEERHKIILSYLDKHEKATVQYFSDYFNVSKETIRKDLGILAGQRLVIRCHGGAMVLRHKFVSDITSTESIASLLTKYQKNKHKHRGEKMNGQVCILGSFNVDIVAQVARFPKGGESIMAKKSMIGPGGKGANQAMAASYAEAKVHFVAKVGKDQFSQFAYDHLSSSKIDSFTLYQSDKEPTGNAVIYVSEEDGENMIAIYSGANLTLTDEEIIALEANLKNADILLVQLENNFDAMCNAMKLAKALGVQVILNPAPYSAEVMKALEYIDIITPNETEASFMSGIEITDLDSAKQAAEKIYSLGVQTVIITLGSKGSLIFDGKQHQHIKPFPAVPVDTTGAGDAFNGAFCASLAKGQSTYQAATYASAFASLAVEREGASNMPSHQQVLQRMNNK